MGLLRERRFAPFFWTQFLGAFTDNAFKNALVIMVAFGATSSEAEAGRLIGIASGLFILPFFIFSPLTGQLADKYEKSVIMRRVKFAEIVIMILAAIGFSLAEAGASYAVPYLIGVLFLMGTQSAFFGPVKFSIIPQHLRQDELMQGTGLVEMGTFAAILFGTMVGGILVAYDVNWVSACLISCAMAGWLFSRAVPEARAANPELRINWNWLTEFKNLYTIAQQKHSILISIIAISWFWFFGAMVLAQLPNLVKYFINGDETVATLFLALFTLSVSLGSISTSMLSRSAIELGLVPVGALGMTVFSLDLGLVDYGQMSPEVVGFVGFLRTNGGISEYRVLFDLAALGVSGSFFIVPLYALLQHRSDPKTLSQVIAGNNVANAIFMVVSAAATAGLYSVGLTTPQLFLVVSVLNTALCLFVFISMPEFLFRLAVWTLGHTFYRVRFENAESIPHDGPCLLVADRSSLLDWLMITTACQRPVRFVVRSNALDRPLLRGLLRICNAIPLAQSDAGSSDLKSGVREIREALDRGHIVGLFSRSPMAPDAGTPSLESHLEELLPAAGVPIIPVALRGLSGSIFERHSDGRQRRSGRAGKREISVAIGDALASGAGARDLRSALDRLASAT